MPTYDFLLAWNAGCRACHESAPPGFCTHVRLLASLFVSFSFHLSCRQALAGRGANTVAAAQDEGPRPILKLTQKFSRNMDVPAAQDVAKRVFDVANGQIRWALCFAHTVTAFQHVAHSTSKGSSKALVGVLFQVM